MVRRIAACLVLIVSLASMSNAALLAQSNTEVSDEEYAVYDAAIAKIFTGRAVNELRIISPTVYLPESLSQMGPVVVLSEEENIKSWNSLFKNIKRQTIEGYEANSKQKAALKRSFKQGFGYVIWEVSAPLMPGEIPRTEKHLRDGDWYIQLSRVGFDREHEQALVYLSYSQGGHVAAGFWLLVAKTGNQWTVDQVNRVWVS